MQDASKHRACQVVGKIRPNPGRDRLTQKRRLRGEERSRKNYKGNQLREKDHGQSGEGTRVSDR